ncbi:predicted protein [Plenodomus lingam JN3]|uniref:Predicted protein n=1 Tax=Leptosphaeria maculans (strain JN3 / isolate v23.1.3 / race Av1-4-5-6-7-8) TaxID=985895 RepID=E4ZLN0_LEPMJ|nr:predicted protein [Plenodomus lingam JN3]CBX92710.1 predicted protein [Plenodomus lingam JN3]
MPCRCDRSAIDVFLSQEDMVEHSYRISPSDRAGAYPSSTGANWTYPCTWHCMVVTVTYDPLDTRRLGYQGCIRFGYTMACVVDYEVPIVSCAAYGYSRPPLLSLIPPKTKKRLQVPRGQNGRSKRAACLDS